MANFEWRPFLETFSAAVLAAPEAIEFELPPEAVASGWLGYAPASEAEIAAAEARLGVTLPPSYRAFLRVTNGWRHCGSAIAGLLPVSAIGWLRDLYPDWIAAWQLGMNLNGPYTYDPEWDDVDYTHLDQTLVISAYGDEALMLLNPARQDAAGEWEGWVFANWIPGAEAAPSFWALMQAELDSRREMTRTAHEPVRASDPPEAVITKLPDLIGALETPLRDMQAAMTTSDDHGYLAGMVEGLTEVLAQVRVLAQRAPDDPAALRAQLRALADEMLRLAAEREQAMRAEMQNPADLMKALGDLRQMLANLGPMQQTIRAGGYVQGLRQGAGIVRWYMNEQ